MDVADVSSFLADKFLVVVTGRSDGAGDQGEDNYLQQLCIKINERKCLFLR